MPDYGDDRFLEERARRELGRGPDAEQSTSKDSLLEKTAKLDAGFRITPAEELAQRAQRMFFTDVASELHNARKKFPHTGAVAVALMEEVGELAKAMLSESQENIYSEAVQVAAMALRCALEGDPSLLEYRQHHQGVDALPARGKRP